MNKYKKSNNDWESKLNNVLKNRENNYENKINENIEKLEKKNIKEKKLNTEANNSRIGDNHSNTSNSKIDIKRSVKFNLCFLCF